MCGQCARTLGQFEEELVVTQKEISIGRLLSLMLELMMVSASNNRIGNVMSIVKRGNSKNWYMHFQLNGQTYIRSSRTTNKKIAEQMEIEWKANLHRSEERRVGKECRSRWS